MSSTANRTKWWEQREPAVAACYLSPAALLSEHTLQQESSRCTEQNRCYPKVLTRRVKVELQSCYWRGIFIIVHTSYIILLNPVMERAASRLIMTVRDNLFSWFLNSDCRKSYWCAASSGRSGCISGHQTGSCRCWECTLWPPGWACSCAPVRHVSHRRKVCLETSPRLHCRSDTWKMTFKGNDRLQSNIRRDGVNSSRSYNSLMRMSGTHTFAVGMETCLTSSKSSGFQTRNSSVHDWNIRQW